MEKLWMDLGMFDGEGAGTGNPAGDGSAAGNGSPAGAAGDGSPTGDGNLTGAESPAGTESPAGAKERAARFRELVNGEYRDVYQAEMQKQVKNRLRGKQELEARLQKAQSVIDLIADRYEADPGDVDGLMEKLRGDEAYYQRAAEAMGVSPEAARKIKENEYRMREVQRSQAQMEREQEARQKVEKWSREAAQARERFPGLDLGQEMENPDFVAMLERGIPVENAYIAMHAEDVLEGAMEHSYHKAREQTVKSIQARGTRPIENGVKAGGAVSQKIDPGKMTRKEREDLEKRALRGERIEF